MPSQYSVKGERSSRFIDWSKFDHLLGTMSDRRVAELAGCTAAAVRGRRAKLGIAPKYKTHWTPQEEAEFYALRKEGKQRCRQCKEVKALSEFHQNATDSKNGRDGYNRWCKGCKSTYQAARIEERRAYWLVAAGGRCQNCGFGVFTVSLDFHHVESDDKSWTPGKLIMSRPIDSVEVYAELDKCVLLCCNCHMAVHRGGLELTYKKREGLGWTVKR